MSFVKNSPMHEKQLPALQDKARELGFQQLGISGVELGRHEAYLQKWLDQQHHGTMEYMARHGSKRSRPNELEPGTLRVISVRLDYLGDTMRHSNQVLQNPEQAYIARYALGRDYHKMMRKRLQKLAEWMQQELGQMHYRVFVDSAPVLERAIAEQAGLGWTGKNTNIIHREHGSWFFLGEIYTDMPLPISEPQTGHCGNCRACLDLCPTRAITAPYTLDARRCISYLTIEHFGPIPVELRPLLGNRIYGCDDCQLVCPWNRFAHISTEEDFMPRHGLDSARLSELFSWDEQVFLQRTEGSPIRRLGHERWLRNIAVALGNYRGPHYESIRTTLTTRLNHPSELVQEHVQWALHQITIAQEKT